MINWECKKCGSTDVVEYHGIPYCAACGSMNVEGTPEQKEYYTE